MWKCICDCGKETKVSLDNLTGPNHVRSCGCLKRELWEKRNTKHGLAKVGKKTREYKIWERASYRAKKYKVECTISPFDINIPKTCPLLGVTINPGSGVMSPNSPSIDRINPKLGYTPDNTWIISARANTAKSDLTLFELKMLVENLEAKLIEQKINETV